VGNDVPTVADAFAAAAKAATSAARTKMRFTVASSN
jgi:hypothetical protein